MPGPEEPRLRLAVTEPSGDGRAKRAVCAALARAPGVAPCAAEVTQGSSARETLTLIAGGPKALALNPEAAA